MLVRFESQGDFMLGVLKQELDVTIEYDRSEPRDAKVIDADIRLRINPNDPNDDLTFQAEDSAIDQINNQNGIIITEMAWEHAVDAHAMADQEESFGRHIRSEIMRGLR